MSDAETHEAAAPRVVKRYANRKLYDTATRHFTSLAEIRTLVRSGIDVQVLDHDSGADLTADTLTQILGVGVRSGGDSETSLLATLIRMPGRVSAAIVDDDRQAEEIRELRSQVELLTKTVAGLLAERSAAPRRKSGES
jgi:polyhydroxyalkanoate synthesis repressor PhaR